MRLTEFCIRRPVFSTVMSVILVLIGLVCGSRLPIMELPKIDKPTITVTSNYHGTNTEIMETSITRVLEEEFSKIEGVELITSMSQQGLSRIMIQFRPGRSLDAASSDIRDKLSRVKKILPNDMEDPTLSKATSDEKPILFVALSSDQRSPAEIAEYARSFLETEFITLDGVGSANVSGGGLYKMNIWLDPLKLAAYDLTAADVFSTINRQTKDFATGQIMAGDREYLVTTVSTMTTPEEFNQLIIAPGDRSGNKDMFVRLSDVGRAEFSADEKDSKILYNGKNAVVIVIVPQSTANPLDVAQLVKKKMKDLQATLPSDFKMEAAIDQTLFIEQAVYEVYETIAIATFLVLLVILGFLGTLRSSFIPLVTIPVSLIGSLIILYVCGFSINILTLLSLVLAIGLVVDDAIIVLENVHRYIEEGESPVQAAIKGSGEISFAVIAMTITLAAVYAPIALSSGMTGKYFREFALTLAGAVIISGFVALTLSPMMCSKFLKPHTLENKQKKESSILRKTITMISDFLQYWGTFIEDSYSKILLFLIRFRKTLVFTTFLISLLGYFLASFYMARELAPEQDRGILSIKAIPPDGATVPYLSKYLDLIDEELDRIPEVRARMTIAEKQNGRGNVMLHHWNKRSKSAATIAKETQEKFESTLTGVQATITPLSSQFGASGGSEDGLTFVLLTPKSNAELHSMKHQLVNSLAKLPQLKKDIRFTGSPEAKEYVVSIDKDKAAALKISPGDIGETLLIMGKGKVAARIKRDGREHDTIVQVEEKYRRSPKDLTDIYVRGEKGVMVALADLIKVEEKTAAPVINHFQRLRSVTIYAKVADGYSFGDALDAISKTAKEILPEGTKIDWEGETRSYFEEQSNMFLVFALALAFIYLVLSAQFESFVDPLVIMLSVPLSMLGALITLKITGQSLNLFSQIGLVTLIGLITKHGILIIDFANAKLAQGHDRIQAVVEASKMRLRPIIMTTAAMVLGAVPLAFATGPGAELRRPIGWVIVGGMTFGTLFTILIIPVVYTFIGTHKNFDWRKIFKTLNIIKEKSTDVV